MRLKSKSVKICKSKYGNANQNIQKKPFSSKTKNSLWVFKFNCKSLRRLRSKKKDHNVYSLKKKIIKLVKISWMSCIHFSQDWSEFAPNWNKSWALLKIMLPCFYIFCIYFKVNWYEKLFLMIQISSVTVTLQKLWNTKKVIRRELW